MCQTHSCSLRTLKTIPGHHGPENLSLFIVLQLNLLLFISPSDLRRLVGRRLAQLEANSANHRAGTNATEILPEASEEPTETIHKSGTSCPQPARLVVQLDSFGAPTYRLFFFFFFRHTAHVYAPRSCQYFILPTSTTEIFQKLDNA